MMDLEILGVFAGVFTSVSMLPQLIKVLSQKKAENLSVGMLLILIAGLSLWIAYGFHKNEFVIIISNAFAIAVNFYLLICCIAYRIK